jgi:hypothetical protein
MIFWNESSSALLASVSLALTTSSPPSSPLAMAASGSDIFLPTAALTIGSGKMVIVQDQGGLPHPIVEILGSLLGLLIVALEGSQVGVVVSL